jgi:hypothetical protein
MCSGRLDTSFKQGFSYSLKMKGKDVHGDLVQGHFITASKPVALCVSTDGKGRVGACYRVGMYHCNCV